MKKNNNNEVYNYAFEKTGSICFLFLFINISMSDIFLKNTQYSTLDVIDISTSKLSIKHFSLTNDIEFI